MCYTTLFISLHKDILDMDIETVDKFLKEFKDKARVFGIIFRIDRKKYLQPIITQYFIDNKSEIWLLFLIAHSKR